MRSVPEITLGYPVLIKFNSGISGSGFKLLYKGFLYLVTAKHVLVNGSNQLHGDTGSITAYSLDEDDDEPNIDGIDFMQLSKDGNILLHQKKDIAVVRIAKLKSSVENSTLSTVSSLNGVSVITKSKAPIVWASEQHLMSYDQVLVGNEVIIFGYPSSIGIPNSPQFDYEKPLLRKGIVAAKYKKASTIILDCPVYYGNSGGPVMQLGLEKDGRIYYKLIGVVSQFVPYVEHWTNSKSKITNTTMLNSGYSVAVSIDSALGMINYK